MFLQCSFKISIIHGLSQIQVGIIISENPSNYNISIETHIHNSSCALQEFS
jgi:hypothetical protein